MLKKKCIICILLLAVILGGCSWNGNKWIIPESGIWYCEDLEMQLCFEKWDKTASPAVRAGEETYSYLVENGTVLMCVVWTVIPHEDKELYVAYQDYTHDEHLGESVLFFSEMKTHGDECHVKIKDGGSYTFERIPYCDVQEYLTERNPQPLMNMGELKYCGNVAQQAIALWESTYSGIEVSADAVEISFDMDADCWLASCQTDADEKQATLMALIQRNGDVLSVWRE